MEYQVPRARGHQCFGQGSDAEHGRQTIWAGRRPPAINWRLSLDLVRPSHMVKPMTAADNRSFQPLLRSRSNETNGRIYRVNGEHRLANQDA